MTFGSVLSNVPDHWRAMIDLTRPYAIAMLVEARKHGGVSYGEMAVLIGDLHSPAVRQLAEDEDEDVDAHIREAEEGGYPAVFSTILLPDVWRAFLGRNLPLALKHAENRPPGTIPLILIDDQNGVHVLVVTPVSIHPTMLERRQRPAPAAKFVRHGLPVALGGTDPSGHPQA